MITYREYEPKSTHCLLFKFYYKKKALTKDNLFGSFFVNINDVKEKDWLQQYDFIFFLLIFEK